MKGKNMRKNRLVKTFNLLMMVLLMTATIASAATDQEKRDKILKMKDEALQKLYSVHPTAQVAIQNAYGYAVFNNSDVQIVFLGGGGGRGVATINGTNKQIFMKAVDVSVGLGLGAKKYMLIFVFESQNAFEKFTSDKWELGGQATAAATDSISGDSIQGAVSVGSDIWVYQLTDKGLELTLTIRGIRYYKDKDLN